MRMIERKDNRDRRTMRHYITNMFNGYRPIVEEALTVIGRPDIHIDEKPMPPRKGGGDPYWHEQYLAATRNYFSIYVDGNTDCSDFWQCFDQLKKSDRWKTWIAICGFEDDSVD